MVCKDCEKKVMKEIEYELTRKDQYEVTKFIEEVNKGGVHCKEVCCVCRKEIKCG